MYKLVVLIEKKSRGYLDEKQFVICQQLVNMIGKHDFMYSLRKCAVNVFPQYLKIVVLKNKKHTHGK